MYVVLFSYLLNVKLISICVSFQGKAVQKGSCIRTNCHIPISACPRNEKNSLGDLVVKGRCNNPVACLSPCKKWNYPSPFGFGRDEKIDAGRMLCCPDPVTPDECQKGLVVGTNYVRLVRKYCPTVFSYSYDDAGGLHNCPASTSFVVNYYS